MRRLSYADEMGITCIVVQHTNASRSAAIWVTDWTQIAYAIDFVGMLMPSKE
jgi:hypothetical protein